MKKKFLLTILMCILIFTVGCNMNQNAEGINTTSDNSLIAGSWFAVGVLYDGDYISFSENKQLADLYDTNWFKIHQNGKYEFQNGPFSVEGAWTYYENEAIENAYLFTDEDGSKKLATIAKSNTNAMLIYDFSFEEDQVMLVYGKDGKNISDIKFSETPYTNSQTNNLNIEKKDTQQNENSANMSNGEKNALQKAYDYLNYTAFSYDGLIEQLEFDGFSYSEAKYAADNCGTDWYEQAALKAQEYLDYNSFSKTRLIEQLEYEGFTYEQALYGVEKVY